MIELLILAFAVSAGSLTIAKAKITRPLREWPYLHRSLNELLRCPYCVSHWLAFALALVTQPLQPYDLWLNILVTTFALVGMSAILTGIAIQVLHIGEAEIADIRAENERLHRSLGHAEAAAAAYAGREHG